MTQTAEPTKQPPLTPYSLEALLHRMSTEWLDRKTIFDLPTARIWAPDPDFDLSMSFLGRPAATPIGPAAGPHSQLAQNIILSWLGGARMFELKTVQVMDELEIARPCIDMETVGFNIEWSQELKIRQSLEEYVKAWMVIEILKHWKPIHPFLGDDPGPYVFDLSVGYDLAGISTPEVAFFIDSMMDATVEIDRLRPQLTGHFEKFSGYHFEPRIADTVTLSTFHGCPPEEIEGISKHLMTRHNLDVVVKLNPTLLGFGNVVDILQKQLGYEDIRLSRESFVDDLQLPRAIELIQELRDFAKQQGRKFGIKLTNTLVVQNDKGFLPDDPMYLSGPPLHVLATALLDELINTLPNNTLMLPGHDGDVQVSWSAGINRENFPKAVGMGVAPATVCSDLLQPGGYGRIKPMLKRLTDTMKEAGVSTLDDWTTSERQRALDAGFLGAVESHLHDLTEGDLREKYHLDAHSEGPRQVEHDLEMWGCVACNFCVTVCPNDAFTKITTPEGLDLEGRQQYFVLVEQCNECGNCMVFCPENGDPAQIKPRLFYDADRFAGETGQAFLLERENDDFTITATPTGEADVPILRELLEQGGKAVIG